MAWLPKSRKARRRLMIVAVAGGVLTVAGALAIVGMGGAFSFYYSPSEASREGIPPGRVIQLGGLVEKGSLIEHADGSVEFVVTDTVETARVRYSKALPDLFKEGQGAVARGAFTAPGQFEASQVLAKHDESYEPRELTKILKNAAEAGERLETSPYGAPKP